LVGGPGGPGGGAGREFRVGARKKPKRKKKHLKNNIMQTKRALKIGKGQHANGPAPRVCACWEVACVAGGRWIWFISLAARGWPGFG
jgi:hypothetical protein